MRFKSPLIAVSAVSMLALSACGGSGSSSSQAGGQDAKNLGNTGNTTDALAKGPVTISGAQKGGTVTVSTLAGLTTTLDPSELYYTDADSYMSGLVTR